MRTVASDGWHFSKYLIAIGYLDIQMFGGSVGSRLFRFQGTILMCFLLSLLSLRETKHGQ
jgi:hypothetical protein